MNDLAFSATATDDELLEQAEALVRAYCGWHISPLVTSTVRVTGVEGHVVVLPSLKVVGVDSVTVAGTVLTADEDYFFSSDGVVTLRSRVGSWDAAVEVVFTHGYDPPPAEVTAVVQAVARRAVDSPGQVVQVGQVRYANATGEASGLLGLERSALSSYRLTRVA